MSGEIEAALDNCFDLLQPNRPLDEFQEQLLDRSIEVLKKNNALNALCKGYAPPLYYANQHGLVTIRKFLEAGADSNAPCCFSEDKGVFASTVFIEAARYGEDILQSYLAHGARLNDKSVCGHSAMDWAVQHGGIEKIRFLQKYDGRITSEAKARFLDSGLANPDYQGHDKFSFEDSKEGSGTYMLTAIKKKIMKQKDKNGMLEHMRDQPEGKHIIGTSRLFYGAFGQDQLRAMFREESKSEFEQRVTGIKEKSHHLFADEIKDIRSDTQGRIFIACSQDGMLKTHLCQQVNLYKDKKDRPKS